MSTEDLAQRWEHIARSPGSWLISADDLRACAELVGQHFVSYFAKRLPPGTGETTEGVPAVAFGPMFLMLAGYSIEALVKGICVAREPEAVVEIRKGRRKLPDWLTTHNLQGLLDRSKVELADADREFLRRSCPSRADREIIPANHHESGYPPGRQPRPSGRRWRWRRARMRRREAQGSDAQWSTFAVENHGSLWGARARTDRGPVESGPLGVPRSWPR
jgi:hypothetical protein